MSRLILAILLAFALLMPFAPSGEAATEDWLLYRAGVDEVTIFVTINPNNLQVDSFTIINNTDRPARLWIVQSGAIIYDLWGTPYATSSQPISGFKYYRVPATDHDDPNSIRIPKDTVFYETWPAQ